MRIALIDADAPHNQIMFPNLALMKLSAYYKQQCHTVDIITSNFNKLLSRGLFAANKPYEEYDKYFIAKIFSKNSSNPQLLKLPNVTTGGTGFFGDSAENLPHKIEHIKPDYSLYAFDKDNKNNQYSYGFTTRGCFRKCDFCVNKKYDKAFRHAFVNEFLEPTLPKISLLDDNILAFAGWDDIFKELENTGKPFKFTQGLDIRLMTDKKAARLSEANYEGRYTFAFDYLKDAAIIEEKLKLWTKYKNRKGNRFYLFCGMTPCKEDIDSLFTRLNIIHQFPDTLPYMMVHENAHKSQYNKLYRVLQQWMNYPYLLEAYTLREYLEAYHAGVIKKIEKFGILKDYINVRYCHVSVG